MCGESWEWGVSLLLLPNETISVVDSEENLSSFVREFGRVCKRRKLKNNVGKIKVLRLTLREEEELLRARLESVELSEFKYLGSRVSVDGVTETKRKHHLGKRAKIIGGLAGLRRSTRMTNDEVGMLETIVMPTVLYRS